MAPGPPSRSRATPTGRRLLLAGVGCIFGGEALCILGPMRYEVVAHAVWHMVLYTGMALAAAGAALHWSGARAGNAGGES